MFSFCNFKISVIDASGRFGHKHGLNEGNLVDLGGFDECINIEVKESIINFTLPNPINKNITVRVSHITKRHGY